MLENLEDELGWEARSDLTREKEPNELPSRVGDESVFQRHASQRRKRGTTSENTDFKIYGRALMDIAVVVQRRPRKEDTREAVKVRRTASS